MTLQFKNTKGRSQLRAFALAEGVVCVGLMGLLVTGLYLGISQLYAAMDSTRQNLRATQILSEKFESIRLFTWDQLNAPGFVPSTWVDYYDYQKSEGAVYKCTVSFSSFGSYSYSDNMRLVTITVTWTNQTPHTRTLQSLLARHGIQNYAY